MSRCNYCRKPILWVNKTNGGWFPPFDMPDDVSRIKYNLVWDDYGWLAEPTDKSKVISLNMHSCVEYEEYILNRQAAIVEPTTVSLDPVEEKMQESIVYVDKPAMSHNQIISMARKLSHKCVQCAALPFIWCTYITGDNFGEETGRLHNMRGL